MKKVYCAQPSTKINNFTLKDFEIRLDKIEDLYRDIHKYKEEMLDAIRRLDDNLEDTSSGEYSSMQNAFLEISTIEDNEYSTINRAYIYLSDALLSEEEKYIPQYQGNRFDEDE